jgi:hypothetical protein
VTVLLVIVVAVVVPRLWDHDTVVSNDGSPSLEQPNRSSSSVTADMKDEAEAIASDAVEVQDQPASTNTSLTITDLRVSVHRGEYADLVGQVAEGVFDARFDDDVRVYAVLSEPCYCYLLALNPDGSEQLCYPDSANQPPEQTEKLEFPGRAITFFGLTDGVGLQGFVLLASRQQLPAFDQWRASVGNIAWAATEAEGVWKYDGQDITRLFNERGMIRERGALRERVPRPFADACLTFSNAPRIEAVQAIAFPVLSSKDENAADAP